jgi:cytosine/adenosine deaminase-related metal-dependent hydrolase/SAM-dependent methyltransferase
VSGNASTIYLSSVDGYRVWASRYDHDPNPMLSLEKRFLEPLLPPVAGLDVVDLGCGTGRWLEVMAGMGPKSLMGVDSSPEMLEIARRKLGSCAKFVHADCATACFESLSADLILCNFLLSYIETAPAFLAKLSSMLRSGGAIFLTDVHPVTTFRLGWRRGVQLEAEYREIRTFPRSLDEVTALCESSGLSVDVYLELRFGATEEDIFRRAGRGDYFEEIRQFPAIYVLQVCKKRTRSGSSHREKTPAAVNSILGATVGLGPEISVVQDVGIVESRIEFLRVQRVTGPSADHCRQRMDLSGFLVLPGLVNVHDHLEFALFPRLGKGGYKNFREWAEDIYHPNTSPVLEHRQVPREVRLWWGGIRNLLCGVTTVCHHNPYEAKVFEKEFVVRVLRDYGWAHSLAMDPEVGDKKRNTPKGQPFLLHLAEGVDEESAREIIELQHVRALDEETVLIHGLALGKKGIELVRAARAGLVWCPSSNNFLFGKTLSAGEIRAVSKVAIGSDSPLSAVGDFLDEIRFAYEVSDLQASELYSAVTEKPSKLLRLVNGEGSIRTGAVADLVAVRDTGQTPADRLVELTYRDIELVLIGGRVQLASTEMLQRLSPETIEGLQPLAVEGTVRWIRAPIEWLFAQTKTRLSGEVQLGGKQVSVGN